MKRGSVCVLAACLEKSVITPTGSVNHQLLQLSPVNNVSGVISVLLAEIDKSEEAEEASICNICDLFGIKSSAVLL